MSPIRSICLERPVPLYDDPVSAARESPVGRSSVEPFVIGRVVEGHTFGRDWLSILLSDARSLSLNHKAGTNQPSCALMLRRERAPKATSTGPCSLVFVENGRRSRPFDWDGEAELARTIGRKIDAVTLSLDGLSISFMDCATDLLIQCVRVLEGDHPALIWYWDE